MIEEQQALNDAVAFITDLDGTLVADSTQVAEEDKALLHQLSEKMYIGIATGRSMKEIHYIEEQCGLICDIKIAFNGGIIDYKGQRLKDCTLPQNDLAELMDYIEEHQIIFDALDNVDRIGTYTTTNLKKLWNMRLMTVPNLYQTLKEKKIYKINLRPKSDEADEMLATLRAHFPQLTICKSGNERIEITPKGISKGEALRMLAEHCHLHFICVGDSENDSSMFEEADQSFCLAHAAPAVLGKVTTVIQTFSELGEHLLPGK